MPVQVDNEFTFGNAAIHTKGFAHQLDAWAWLQNNTDPKIVAEFKLRYRNSFRPDTIETQYRCPKPAAEIIKDFEGFRAKPYRCSAGVWTIGYGTTRYPDSVRVSPDDHPISETQATTYMLYEIEKEIMPQLAKSVPFWGAMDSFKKSALISFAYNMGEYFMLAEKDFETIQRVLRGKEWDKVPDAMALYRKSGGKVNEGLIRRREAEGDLWKGFGAFTKV